ncbi:hypothetical protein V8E51_014542 [Hyaloscypha variabilis]
MPVSFGFSAGDFIAAIELVATVIDALRESGDASSEYREIVRQLSPTLPIFQPNFKPAYKPAY